MTTWIPVTIQNVTSLYLYGSVEPPSDLVNRLRPDFIQEIDVTTNVADYMTSPGRYASLFQTNIVNMFFKGDFSLASFSPDQHGGKSVTLSQLLAAGVATNNGNALTLADAQVSISQYTTNVGSTDWLIRSYAYGSTSFVLSQDYTRFVEDSAGNLSIVGGAMLPYDTDFDLESGNPFAQLYNGFKLKDLLDPYNIGRKVNFIFSAEEKAAYGQAHAADVYTASDAPSDLGNFLAGVVDHYFGIPDHIADLLAGSSALREGISQGAQYVVDGHNLVFGSNGMDTLNQASGRGDLYDRSLPDTFIGGDGTDQIVASDADYVFAGVGDDRITIRHGASNAKDAGVTLYTGSGKDVVNYVGAGGSERDVWYDAEAHDALSVNGQALDGGNKTLLNKFYHESYTDTYGFEFTSADDIAWYNFYPEFSDSLSIRTTLGHSLEITGFANGVAGLTPYEGQVEYTNDIYAYFPAMQAVDFSFNNYGLNYYGLSTAIFMPNPDQ